MTAAQILLSLSDDLGAAVPTELSQALDLVEDVLTEGTRSRVELVETAATSTLRAGGKRIRPALTLVSALACRTDADIARTATLGACLEMVHMATLMHDDVIDGSATRRGRPTAGVLVGTEAAVLSGDVLLAKAMNILALDGDIEVIRLVSSAVVALAEGEILEIQVRGRFDLAEHELDQVVEMKTAALLRACCQIGALVTSAPARHFDALSEFGACVGRAFQAIDDILDYVGNPARTGKAVGQDFREGQATMPLLLYREKASAEHVAWAEQRFGKDPSEQDFGQIVDLMVSSGCIEEARRRADAELDRALAALGLLPESPYRNLLETMALALVRREG
ncbi:MAG: polyprenyl synthetase family protein [Fimbriimonadaceae bacterium]|nr:polyprenyl synthetase family protein [Fimbriimonadaceae bacterium]